MFCADGDIFYNDLLSPGCSHASVGAQKDVCELLRLSPILVISKRAPLEHKEALFAAYALSLVRFG